MSEEIIKKRFAKDAKPVNHGLLDLFLNECKQRCIYAGILEAKLTEHYNLNKYAKQSKQVKTMEKNNVLKALSTVSPPRITYDIFLDGLEAIGTLEAKIILETKNIDGEIVRSAVDLTLIPDNIVLNKYRKAKKEWQENPKPFVMPENTKEFETTPGRLELYNYFGKNVIYVIGVDALMCSHYEPHWQQKDYVINNLKNALFKYLKGTPFTANEVFDIIIKHEEYK